MKTPLEIPDAILVVPKRRLPNAYAVPARIGSTQYFWKPEDVDAGVYYVLHEQGEPMAAFDGTREFNLKCGLERNAEGDGLAVGHPLGLVTPDTGSERAAAGNSGMVPFGAASVASGGDGK